MYLNLRKHMKTYFILILFTLETSFVEDFFQRVHVDLTLNEGQS